MKTFCKVGDRVAIYQRPYTKEELEGEGVVTLIAPQSDTESAFVAVRFDNEGDGVYWRWILPDHVK